MLDSDDITGMPDMGQETPAPAPVAQRPPKTAADWIRDMRMSSDVNKNTVGVESDRVTPALLAATTKKMLGISRREQEPDPKDSLAYQRFYGPAEYFAEHILRDGGKVARDLLWKATNRGNIDFIQPNALEPHTASVFYDSKLAQLVEGSSPLEAADATYKTTRIGEGGIAGVRMAPDEMRTVQPSYFGFIDGIRSPERLRVGLDMYMTKNVMKGTDGKLYAKFINAKTGQEELLDSVTASNAVIASREMMDAKTKSVFALGGKTGIRIVPKSDVQYYLARPDDAYSMGSNMVPMLSGIKEMRLLMGCLHPSTYMIVQAEDGSLDILLAKELNGTKQSLPGMADGGKETLFPIRDTLAKFPDRRAKFKKVILKSGRCLMTSADHRWEIVEGGKQVKRLAAELKPGDRIPRSLFRHIENRPCVINGKQVTPAVAGFVGTALKTLEITHEKYRIEYMEAQEASLDAAMRDLGITAYSKYRFDRRLYIAIHDTALTDWLKRNIGIAPEERKVPSCFLTAARPLTVAFLDGYTHNLQSVGMDGAGDVWVLDIANGLLREGLALLFQRCDTDSYYRDSTSAGEEKLALKLVPAGELFGDMALDTVKAVLDIKNPPVMIDVDINDNLYAVSNGIVTHNSKYPTQAVSLDNRETPLVRALDEASGKSMPEVVGKYLGAKFAPKGGTVIAVRDSKIDVLYDDGQKASIPLYRNFPANQKGFLDNTPVVKAGQVFKPGQVLASSNYTDKDGVAAIGTNLRSAWCSFKGATYEDAIGISEEAAKKLTSTIMYKTGLGLDKSVRTAKSLYTMWKPGEFNKDQLKTLDDAGVVVPGTVLKKGDPVILGVQTTEPSPGTLGKRLLSDVSERWEHESPGIVTDVVKTRKGIKVYTKTTLPAQEGDKLGTPFGNKGIIARIIPMSEMPVGKDGKPLDILFSPLGILTRCYDDNTEFLTKDGWKFGKDVLDSDILYCFCKETGNGHWGKQQAPFYKKHYEGTMYCAKNKATDFCVTKGHKVWAKTDVKGAKFKETVIEDIFGKRYCIPCVAPLSEDRQATSFALPPIDRRYKDTRDRASTVLFDPYAWAEFLGWYMAEGNTDYIEPVNGKASHYSVNIAQFDTVNPDKVNRIRNLLNRLGFKYSYGKDNKQFHITDKRLAHYMKQFGYCDKKHMPEWLLQQPMSVMRKFLEALEAGDGTYTTNLNRKDGSPIYRKTICLTSERLIDQLQAVYTMLGVPTRKVRRPDDHRYQCAKPVYALGISTSPGKTTRILRGNTWYTKAYSGMVYCPTVASGYVVTRRNGVVICMGNTNSSQVPEAMLGKVAAKTGVPINVPAFSPESFLDFADRKLKEAKLSDTEDLTDPSNGKIIPGVLTGVSHVFKLKHIADTKLSGRGTDAYTMDDQPGGSGPEGSKRYGNLEIGALVGHGAQEVIKDAHLIRGQANSDFWRSIRTGEIPVMPGEPLIYKKFFAHLQGSGINVRKTPRDISVFSLSNRDVSELAGNRELKSRNTYEAKNFRPLDGGLFGQDIFGPNGDQWGYIQLDAPVPNPVMEEPLARLLRMPVKKFSAVATGAEEVNGIRGPQALKEALSKLDLDAEAAKALQELKNAPMSKKDAALKRYRDIANMAKQKVNPAEYMLDRIPVLPPIFRPISTHGDLTMVSDSNYLYAQLLDARDEARKAANLPDEYKEAATENIYNKWKELVGLYDPEGVKMQQKNVRGLLQWALGTGPKFSMFQRKIIGTPVDTVGRGVVMPDARLKLNQLGIPEPMAWKIMEPFVVRKLVRAGYTPVDAMKAVKDRAENARAYLYEVASERPVQMNRAPSLHKLSIQGFDPIIVPGNVIHTNPSIVGPFAMDFDGDQANIHVPVSAAAVRETRDKMFPDRNLLSMRTRRALFKPEKEYLQGLYLATAIPDDAKPILLKDLKEAMLKYHKGDIKASDPIAVPD